MGREKRLELGKVMKADEDEIHKPYCPVAAIRTRVKHLAFVSTLKSEDDKMKAKFADRFPEDIPHLDDLPSNIYHRIRLTDANLTISRRQYDCPKKYHEAWKILLNHFR